MLKTFFILSIGLAFAASLFSFRLNTGKHLKVFSLLLGLTLLVEISALIIVDILKIDNNIPLYNVFMLIEFWVYAWYFKQTIRFTKIKKVITAFLYCFPCFWVMCTFFIFGINGWDSYVILVGSFFTICMCVIYYYQLLKEDDLFKLSNHTEFWIATGMLIFYSCTLPYTGMFYFLTKNYYSFADKMVTLMDILDCIMYILFTYAFVCRINTRKH